MRDLLILLGVPTAVTSAVIGLFVWWFKRHISKRDEELARERAEAVKKEENTETLILMIMQTVRATYVVAEATAKAVQRIPDAHCNGDMTSALEKAAKIQQEEQQFIIDQGVKHIFGE